MWKPLGVEINASNSYEETLPCMLLPPVRAYWRRYAATLYIMILWENLCPKAWHMDVESTSNGLHGEIKRKGVPRGNTQNNQHKSRNKVISHRDKNSPRISRQPSAVAPWHWMKNECKEEYRRIKLLDLAWDRDTRKVVLLLQYYGTPDALLEDIFSPFISRTIKYSQGYIDL